MRTLASELGSHIGHLSVVPRVYADANVPTGLVAFMRTRLRWEVLFVMEHPDLRRASDHEHFRLATRLHRTLITLDHDYFDDRRFPPLEGAGVIVLTAPDERTLARVIARVDRAYFRSTHGGEVDERAGLPLRGRKLHAHPGWTATSDPHLA